MLEFANTKLWGSWSSLIDSLRTGNPPSRMGGEDDFFAALYNTPENLREFLAAMTGLSTSRAGHRTPPAAACACPRSPVVGGALIVYNAIIDDERRENAFGLLMSLNMLVETRAGSASSRRRSHHLETSGSSGQQSRQTHWPSPGQTTRSPLGQRWTPTTASAAPTAKGVVSRYDPSSGKAAMNGWGTNGRGCVPQQIGERQEAGLL
jgi:hypothetical protein